MKPEELALRKKYEDLLKFGNEHPDTYQQTLTKLRQLILMEGFPKQTKEEIRNRETQCSLRGKLWKVFLGVKSVDGETYLRYVSKGPSDHYDKIERDRDRTFQHDECFHHSVSQQSISRVLNAFVHAVREKKTHSVTGYVQGMNALCGCLLYTMPEADAFQSFCMLMFEHMPAYFSDNISGVYNGTHLLATCLRLFDPQLYEHLKQNGFGPELLMHPVLSLSTSVSPLSQVIHLWDFLLAFGVHLGVVAAAAQVILQRDALLAHQSPCSTFRQLPPLNAAKVTTLVVILSRELNDKMWDLLIEHVKNPGLEIPTSIFDPNEFPSLCLMRH